MEAKQTILWLNSPESSGPKMITVESLDEDDPCQGLGVPEDSDNDSRRSLSPHHAARLSSDCESLHTQDTSDSECGSVSYTGGKKGFKITMPAVHVIFLRIQRNRLYLPQFSFCSRSALVRNS
jgi:hypothetical protein